MKKKVFIGLIILVGTTSNLFADLAIGISEYQSIIYMDDFNYSLFNGIGVDCEYDFLESPIRPMVGISTTFYGIGLEIALKAGGIFDIYNGDINRFNAQLNYLTGYNLFFSSAIHGLDCLLCYEYNIADEISLYLKSGIEYRYFTGAGGQNYMDIPIRLGVKFK